MVREGVTKVSLLGTEFKSAEVTSSFFIIIQDLEQCERS